MRYEYELDALATAHKAYINEAKIAEKATGLSICTGNMDTGIQVLSLDSVSKDDITFEGGQASIEVNGVQFYSLIKY